MTVPDPAMAEQRMRHWLSDDVEILTGFTEDCRAVLAELDRLRGKNTNQGLALAQTGHELAQLQARRALVLDWCRHRDTPVRFAEHVRTLLGEDAR